MPVYDYYYFLFLEGVHERSLTGVPFPSLCPNQEEGKWGWGIKREDRRVILDHYLRTSARIQRYRQL